MRPRAALLALPALLLLLAMAAGGRPARREHAGDGPAITAAAASYAHVEAPALDLAPPLLPAVIRLPAPTFVALADPAAQPAASACGSAYALSDRPLLL